MGGRREEDEEDEEREEGGPVGDRTRVSSRVPLGVIGTGRIDPAVSGTLYLLHRGRGEKLGAGERK